MRIEFNKVTFQITFHIDKPGIYSNFYDRYLKEKNFLTEFKNSCDNAVHHENALVIANFFGYRYEVLDYEESFPQKYLSICLEQIQLLKSELAKYKSEESYASQRVAQSKSELSSLLSQEKSLLLTGEVDKQNISKLEDKEKQLRVNLQDVTTEVNAKFKEFISKATPFQKSSLLYKALMNNLEEYIPSLMNQELDASYKLPSGESFLVFALKRGDVKLCEALAKDPKSLNIVDKDNKSILQMVLDLNNNSLLKALFSKITKSHEYNIEGESILDYMCHKGVNSLELYELVLKGGYDVNKVNKHDETSLFTACQDGLLNVVQLLIKSGFSVNATASSVRYSVLQLAATESSHQIIKVLLENGANVNYQDTNGDTALFYSLHGRNLNAFEILISFGADLNITNNIGARLRDIVLASEDEKFCKDYIASLRAVNVILKIKHEEEKKIAQLEAKKLEEIKKDISKQQELNNELKSKVKDLQECINELDRNISTVAQNIRDKENFVKLVDSAGQDLKKGFELWCKLNDVEVTETEDSFIISFATLESELNLQLTGHNY